MFKTTENQMDDGDIPIKINSDINSDGFAFPVKTV